MTRFTLPRDIYHGENALAALRGLKGKRAFVVTGGSSMRKFGFLDRVTGCLRDAGMETAVFGGVEPDPSVDTVMRGAAAMTEFGPDWIVAVGGGSPIDAAKAMWIFYEHPETKFEDLFVPFSFPELRRKARFCAIPSTSGTATEVTAFSVITDYAKGIKYPLADFNITPDVAIVDPALAMTMPEKLAAHTGMDALTHAVEAYVSSEATDFTDADAIYAVKLINLCLADSVAGRREARERMHNAQCLAGMAFSNALLGITHSMAHKTGAAFSGGHVVHGCANAIYLPYVILYNAADPRARLRYGELAAAMGLEPDFRALVTRVRELDMALGIPTRLADYENGLIDEKEFVKKAPEIARLAVADACTLSNPRKITPPEMEKLLACCYYGGEVDF